MAKIGGVQNYGTGLDVVAPCVKIASTDIQGTGGYNTAAGVAGNYYNIFNGTSSACPNAAGVAALLYSVDSSLTLLQATQIFELSCDKLPAYTYAISSDPNQPNGTWNTQTGHGRVNALAALQLAQSGNYCVSQIQASGTTICSTPILLSIVNAVAGATYEWRRNGVVVGAGLTYSTAVAGNYDAVVTRGTCTAVSAVVILSKSVILSASASPDSVCAGGSSTLTANAVNSFSYCTPTYTNGTGAGDYISYVNIATTTLNNTTTGAASPYYTLFPQSGSTTASLAAAAGYTLSLRGGTYATCLIRGWIDYNQDGVFAATETIGISANVGSQALGTISFTVPAGAANGVTRLRLRSSDTNPGPGTGTACAATNSSWGETEDYVITIAGGVSPFTYSWAEVPVNGTLITNNMASVTASGISLQETYTVTVTSTLGCTNTFSQVVNVKALNSIVAATPAVSPLCGSATTTISANGVAGTNPVVTWFTAAGGTGTNLGTGINLSNAGAGTYYARVTGTCGAAAETVVTIAAITPTAISIDAAPATQTILISAPAANLSVTANGNNLTYQWYSNSININSGGTDLGAANGAQTTSFSPLTNSAGILYYYCIVTGDCGSTSSGTAQVTVVTANTWKSGNPTNDWNTGNNWSLGVIPTGSSNALIPTGNTPYPALSLSSAVNNLIIQAGATVNLNGYLFTINGTVSGTGTLSGSPVSSLEINATNTLRFATGANSLRNFTVNSAAVSLANQLTIAAGLSAGNEGNLLVTGTGILNTGGNLTIESNQFGTASIAQGSASGNYINGDVTVERYIDGSPKRAWRMLAAPTYGQTIKQSWQENQSAGIDPGTGYGTIITSNSAGWLGSGFDYQTPGNSLLVYNPVTNAWETVANTALPVSTAGANKAYMIFIRGNRSATPFNGPYSTATVLRTKGPVFQGDQPPVSLPGAGKFSVIGNNYASAIDFTTITDPNIDPMFLVWDPKLAGSRGLGGYQTFAATNGWQPTPGGGSYPAAVPNTTIQSGQAFAVYTTPGNGNITLYESSKVTGSNMVFRPMTAIVSFHSNLYAVSDGTEELADGNTVVFNSDLSNEVDNRDAIKLENIGENLGVLRRGKLLAVEGRQPIGINDTIFFRMSKLRTQKYRLKFAAENFSSNVAVFLEDKFLQTSTPVDMQYDNSFDFNIAADTVSSAADRFRIVFKQVALLPVTFISLTAIRRAPIVNVGWKVGSENGIVAYEVQRSTDGTVFITAGNVVVAGSVTANEKLYNFTDMSFTAGTVFYRVKSIGINGETKYSDIVKLTEGKIKPGYTVSPNPVNRNVVNIIFENKCRGKYQLRLLAMDGKLLQSATTEHAGGSASQQLNLNAAVTRGNYLLEITAPGEIKTTERIFISDSK
ncbi:MAG: S8 family peptidase [Chitinophagaceae bacterium]|nr:S8 family peptidase [Chitinophagaceae bacterium]